MTQEALSREQALELCREVREENRGRWYAFSAVQCWGCMKWSGGDPEKMCMSTKPGFRGCSLVNHRYEAGRSSPGEKSL